MGHPQRAPEGRGGPPPLDTLISLPQWTDYFRALFNPDDPSPIPPLDIPDPDAEESKPATIDMNSDITPEEIAIAVAKLKLGKAHYIDNVSPEMIQFGHCTFASYFHSILRDCHASGIYPSVWAQAYIVPIHKQGS